MNRAASNQKLSDYLTLVAVKLNFIKTKLLNSIDHIYYYHASNERMLQQADDIMTAPETLAELAKSQSAIICRKVGFLRT